LGRSNEIFKVIYNAILFFIVACNESDNDSFVSEIQTIDVFEQPSQSFVQGENIIMKLQVTNISNTIRTLVYPTTQVFDFVLVDSKQNISWSFSANILFYIESREVSLTPKKSYEASFEWDKIQMVQILQWQLGNIL